MPAPSPNNIMTFTLSSELELWFTEHYKSETELWIKIFKKSTNIPSVTWNDVVIESLRWGWIDGIKKSLDDQAYLQRITPRKARSNWSKKNRTHAQELINTNRMMESGLAQVLAAKADGRWENAYTASEIEVPEDFINALENDLNAKQFFETLTKSSRYIIAYGLTSAKKQQTRDKRYATYMNMLASHEKPT